jgi:hypothetical protein
MAKTPDYRAIGERIQAGEADPDLDGPAVMALLGCETRHDGDRTEYRLPGGTGWRPCPRLHSADDFEEWVLNVRGGQLDDVGRDEDGREFYVSYQDPEHGNDYGQSRRLGGAMWAAFVHVAGRVERD